MRLGGRALMLMCLAVPVQLGFSLLFSYFSIRRSVPVITGLFLIDVEEAVLGDYSMTMSSLSLVLNYRASNLTGIFDHYILLGTFGSTF